MSSEFTRMDPQRGTTNISTIGPGDSNGRLRIGEANIDDLVNVAAGRDL